MKSHYPNCQLGDRCNCAEQDEPDPDETPTSETVEIIREYNRWRRGDESVTQPPPNKIGIALDEVCNLVESMERERDAARDVARHLWDLVDWMAKRYVGKNAPAPPALPWTSAENASVEPRQ